MSARRWVTFDCYGTLVDWRRGFAGMLTPIAGDRVWDLVRAYEQCERQVEHDEPHQPYRDVLVSALRRAALETGVSALETQAARLPAEWGSIGPFEDVESMLAVLRGRGYGLAVLTNCDDDLFAQTHRRFQIPFDLVVTAERVRGYKPAPWHFRAFELITKVRRRDWVHVGCSWFHDIAPAQALGIKRVWLDRDGTGAATADAAPRVRHAGEAVRAIESLFGPH